MDTRFEETGNSRILSALADGRVLAADCRHAAVWDPATGVWSRTADRHAPEIRDGSCRLATYRGRVLLFDQDGCMSELVEKEP